MSYWDEIEQGKQMTPKQRKQWIDNRIKQLMEGLN
jgi:hypothetical protein